MFNKIKIAAVLTTATLVLAGCTSEAEKAEQRLEDYTPDTSLPITQQIADSGVATIPYDWDEERWDYMGMAYCSDVLNIDKYPEYETTDDIMVDGGFGDFWDKGERDTVARIFTTNHCPNRSAK